MAVLPVITTSSAVGGAQATLHLSPGCAIEASGDPRGIAVIRSTSHLPYFAGSERAVHLISVGWQAIPIFEQLTVLSASRRHEPQASVPARHLLSLSPKPLILGGVPE